MSSRFSTARQSGSRSVADVRQKMTKIKEVNMQQHDPSWFLVNCAPEYLLLALLTGA